MTLINRTVLVLMLLIISTIALKWRQLHERQMKRHRRIGRTGSHDTDLNQHQYEDKRKGFDKDQGSNLRVYQGVNATSEYSYVVVLVKLSEYNKTKIFFYRYCTGSLISSNWVLTAGHCLPQEVKTTRVYYGNSTRISIQPDTPYVKVLEAFHCSNYLKYQFSYLNIFPERDIALLLVETVDMQPLGKLCATDFKSLIGLPVTYVGGGGTYSDFKNQTTNQRLKIIMEDFKRPLQVGKAVVVQCYSENENGYNSQFICMRARCSERLQQARPGDSGGPLLLRGKIIGVCTGGMADLSMFYTPVSPFLDWIHFIMSKNYEKKYKVLRYRHVKTKSEEVSDIDIRKHVFF